MLTVRSRVTTGIGWEVVAIAPWEVCRTCHADKVIHATLWNRSLEAIRLPNNPARQIATVATADNPEAVCIGPATRDGIIHARHHIFHRRNAPVTLQSHRPRFAVALATAWIRIDHAVASRRKDLILEENILSTVHRVRTAMDVNQRWRRAIRSWAQDKRWRIVAAWRLAKNLNRLHKRKLSQQLGIRVVNAVIREADHTSIIPTHL